MTFKEYLATRRVTDTPQGDFTQDARGDERLPDVQTWEALKRYVQFRTSNSDVVEAAYLVWQGYVAKKKSVKQK